MSEQKPGTRKNRPRPPLGVPGGVRRQRPVRQLAFWVVLFRVLLLSFQHWMNAKTKPEKITYSQFITEVDKGNIKELTFITKEVKGELVQSWL